MTLGLADESHPELDSRVIVDDQLYLLCSPARVARKLTSPVVRRPISLITRKGHQLPPAGELFVAAFG